MNKKEMKQNEKTGQPTSLYKGVEGSKNATEAYE
tara:strand:+ start:1214 stop:1315 length:102 start_codon:yes stop_codon:yes gene_type:complete